MSTLRTTAVGIAGALVGALAPRARRRPARTVPPTTRRGTAAAAAVLALALASAGAGCAPAAVVTPPATPASATPTPRPPTPTPTRATPTTTPSPVTPSIAASPTAATPTGSPSEEPTDASTSCVQPGVGRPLVDPVSGFELLMPADWRLLPIGDPAWVTIYGDRPSGVEGQVRDGTIQDFALPLLSRDARLLSLAVYVRSTAVGTTLETLADGYQDVLTSTVINGYGPGTMIDRKTVDLPAGPAVRLESTLPYTRDEGIQSPPAATDDASRDDHVVAWVLQHGTRAYYLVFRGNERIIGDHDIEFGCMAGSLEFTSPNP